MQYNPVYIKQSRFKLKDLLLWQQVQDELWRTNQSKIKLNHQQSNPAELTMYEEQAPGAVLL